MTFIYSKAARNITLPALLLLSLCNSTNSFASSLFDSGAIITFNFSSNTDGLDITGDFGIPDSFVIADDGVAYPIVPTVLPTPGNPNPFSVKGLANSGQLKSQHIGVISLSISNPTASERTVDLTMDYELHASVNGDDWDSDVVIDFYNNDFSFSGSDFINATLSVPSSNDFTQTGSSGLFSFTLAPGASETLSADVKITSTLQANIPLPAAVWLFLAGFLGILKGQINSLRHGS